MLYAHKIKYAPLCCLKNMTKSTEIGIGQSTIALKAACSAEQRKNRRQNVAAIIDPGSVEVIVNI